MSKEEIQSELIQTQMRLQGFTYVKRCDLLPELCAAIATAGGWVLEQRARSSDALELRVELPAGELPGVYGTLLASGLHLTRDSHRALAERCNLTLHLPTQHGASSYLLIQLELYFVPEPSDPLDLMRLLPPTGSLD